MSPTTLQASPAPACSSTPPSDWRVLWPWYFAEGVNSYAATLLTAGCYWFATREMHASPAQGLWLSAAWGAAYIFIALLAGKMTDLWGPRRMIVRMIIGATLTAAAGLSALHAPSLWKLVLVMLAYNVTSSQIWPALEAAITRSPARMALPARVSIYNLVWSGLGFLAFLTTGSLADFSWRTIFLVPAMASAVGLIVILTNAIPESMIATHEVHAETQQDRAERSVSARRAQTLLLMAWIGNALAYTGINVLIPLMPTLAAKAGVTALAAGTAIGSIWSLARFAGFALAWYWSGWHYKVRWLLAAQVALAACFFLMVALPHPGILVAGQILFGLAAAFIYASSLYYAMHVSSGAGGHAGIHEALIGLGIAVGPTLGALAGTGAQSTGRIAWSVSALLIGGALVMGAVAWRRPKAEPARQAP